jgi:hypothetical protein
MHERPASELPSFGKTVLSAAPGSLCSFSSSSADAEQVSSRRPAWLRSPRFGGRVPSGCARRCASEALHQVIHFMFIIR